MNRILATTLLLSHLGCSAYAGASAPSAFKLYIADTGVYRLTHAELSAAGATHEIGSDRLTLTNREQDVPIWVEDGGDGQFGPGDHLEFFGEHLRGAHSYFDDYARFNVYRLSTVSEGGARMHGVSLPAQQSGSERAGALSAHLHLEEDNLMVRFTARRGQEHEPELWFWTRLNHSDKAPFEVELDLQDRMIPTAGRAYSKAAPTSATAPSATGDSEVEVSSLSLRLHMKGWSRTTRRLVDSEVMPDHLVKVWLNKTLLATATWAGQEEYTIDLPKVPAEAFNPVRNVLRVRVPKRQLAPGKPLIDAVLLNWIEIDFPHGGRLTGPVKGARQHPLSLHGGGDTTVAIRAPGASILTLYGDDGSRFETAIEPSRETARESEIEGTALAPASREAGTVHAVLDHDFLTLEGVAPDHLSRLRDRDQQADYLLITVAPLREAVEPLAAYHREQGLRVAIVDVEDIYDEFNDSVTHPRAIRDFVSHAYHRWQAPAPRFVLMVGDASWDVRSQQPNDAHYADWVFRGLNRSDFLKNKSTAYEGELDRNLVPTWRFESMQGHAASDNYFVSVDGDDHLPDLAIGRFPIATSAEAAAIVAKTLNYARESGVGPWRRRMLWITNEHDNFKRRTDRIAQAMNERGLTAEKIYPSAEEADNSLHQARLRSAFDAGQVLVHFLGHGGRYIWRTGPPDYRKNHDLFTLDDLEALAPNARLPLVLSMSCYSAPFDHPTADSIGEKFLRLPGRGAIAVFAASWRNSPSAHFSQKLLSELLARETIGEAILYTKQQSKSRLLNETYNLLGDPAIVLALPRLPLDLEASRSAEGWQADVVVDPGSTLGKPFRGEAVIDWLDAAGEILESRTVEVDEPRFTVFYRDPELAPDDVGDFDRATAPAIAAKSTKPTTIRVYAWNQAWQVDGMVGQALPELEAELSLRAARLGN